MLIYKSYNHLMKRAILFTLLNFLLLGSYAQQIVDGALPVFSINTQNQRIIDEPKIDVTLSISETDPISGITEITYDGYAGIEIRGRSSQSFDKKSFGLETRDRNGDNLNISLLDLPAENDWVLHGPYADKSLIRNALTYQLASSLGNYAPRTRMIELVIDDEYHGVYMLTEKVKRDKNRVNIKKLTNAASDISGGYLFQINFNLETPQDGWTSRRSYLPNLDLYSDYAFVYPKPEDITGNQAMYLETWMHDLETLLVSPDYADPLSGYPSKIDTDSWIDYILINELSRDVDAYNGSTFLIKQSDDRGGKLQAGPVWDHNFSYGNSDYCGGQSVEGFAIEFKDVCQFKVAPIIFANVWQDPAFRQKAATRWFELREKELGPALFNTLDSLGELLRIPAKQNFDRWPVLDTYLWPNAYVGKTYQDELQYLGNWISGRLSWLDQRFSEELAIPSPREVGTIISPNPASAFATPHLKLQQAATTTFEVSIHHSNGALFDTFNVLPQEVYIPIPPKLLPGIYIITFQTDNMTAREHLKLIVQ